MPDNDGLREGFSQACQMYRHFITMKYYTFGLFGGVTAGLATLFFTQLPNMKEDDAGVASVWIKLCGAVVAVVAAFFDWRLTDLLNFYQARMASLAKKLAVEEFGEHPQQGKWVPALRVLSLVVYVVAVVAWVFFAKAAMGQHKQ